MGRVSQKGWCKWLVHNESVVTIFCFRPKTPLLTGGNRANGGHGSTLES